MARTTVSTPKPIDIYVRVSRVAGREGDSFQSPKQQEDRCRAQLAADGLKVGQVFVDLDQSGKKASRPAFDQALARIEDGTSGGISVYDLSRFGRNTEQVLAGVKLIEKHGAMFISCAEKIDTTTSTGRMILTLLAAIRQMELEQHAERWEISKRGAVARGERVGVAPAGYKKAHSKKLPDGTVKTYGPLMKVEPDATKIEAAFHIRANGGSWSQVAEKLEGVSTSRREGGSWTSLGARKLITSEIYKGVLDKDSPPILELAIVSPSVWERAQPKTEVGKKKRTGTTLLSGLLKCGGCGRALAYSNTIKGGKSYAFYRCTSGKQFCPSPARVSANEVEPYITGVALDIYAGGGVEVGHDSDPEEVKRLEIERDAALAELEAFMESTSATNPLYKKGVETREQVYEAAQMALLEEKGASRDAIPEDEVRTLFASATHDEKRLMIRTALGLKVTVTRGDEPIAERVDYGYAGPEVPAVEGETWSDVLRRAEGTEEVAA